MDPDEHVDAGERPADRPPVGGYDATPPEEEQAEAAPRRRGNRHHTARRRNRSRQGARPAGEPSGAGEAGSRQDHPGRLQGAMASGRTPGKRAAKDPGAAPLGTDDEAAGTPPTPQAIGGEVERAEQEGGRSGLTAHEAMTGPPGHPEESPRGFGKFVTIAAAIVIALIVWMLVI